MKKCCYLVPWLLMAPLWADQAQGQDTAVPELASDSQSQPSAGAADRSKETPKANDKKSDSGTSKDRLFFTLPNFLTLENSANVPPLTAGEKFKVTARGSFDPIELVWYGALAGIAQWEGNEPQYGQGAKGYAERYGVRFADGTIENFMTKAIFPSVLHQDPRYFQSGQGGFLHRTAYAVSRIFVTRGDSGHSQFNFSEIFGSATAAGISTYAYHTHDEHDISNVADVWITQMAFDTLSNVMKEFWPDLRRKIHPAKQGAAQSAAAQP